MEITYVVVGIVIGIIIGIIVGITQKVWFKENWKVVLVSLVVIASPFLLLTVGLVVNNNILAGPTTATKDWTAWIGTAAAAFVAAAGIIKVIPVLADGFRIKRQTQLVAAASEVGTTAEEVKTIIESAR